MPSVCTLVFRHMVKKKKKVRPITNLKYITNINEKWLGKKWLEQKHFFKNIYISQSNNLLFIYISTKKKKHKMKNDDLYIFITKYELDTYIGTGIEPNFIQLSSSTANRS